jgi:hypothetical protein
VSDTCDSAQQHSTEERERCQTPATQLNNTARRERERCQTPATQLNNTARREREVSDTCDSAQQHSAERERAPATQLNNTARRERERGVRHLRLSSTTQHGERESTGWAHTEVDTPLPSSHPRFNQVLPSDAFIKGLWVPSSRLSSSRSRPKRAHSLSSAPWRRRTPPTHEQTIHQPPSALLVVSSDKPIDD